MYSSGDCQHIWDKCLGLIKTRVPSQTYSTWFQPVKAISLNEKALFLQVPNKFFYDWLDSHYKETIHASLREVTGNGLTVQYTVLLNDQSEENENTPDSLSVRGLGKVSLSGSAQTGMLERGTRINENYVFENFVEGNSNQFAKAASIAVANAPGKTSFNPLVIYGGTGLGKTHLLQAIGNHALLKGYARKILYVSSDTFTLDFIAAIQKNKTTEFSRYYRSVDMLLLDDIQFFQNKEQTQEQFFHIFNDLYQHRKQIVLTTDRPPLELRGLQERLLSRFQSSLTVDIQPPDLETRIAILNQKAASDGLDVPYDVIEFIAQNVKKNIRELEGFLIRLLAYSSLTRVDIDINLARKVLRETGGIEKKTKFSIEDIQKIVSTEYSINLDSLVGKSRTKEIAEARMIAMFLAREHTDLSLKTIGLYFGGRDHSTVVHACKSVEERVGVDERFANRIEVFKNKIQNII
ncbi:MAG: chromosomal replication initiator protein DnaA [Candidatus Marinimicrobia bacterium]|nr:chromosomal replication initiator protein DnaA [Candidatus Neomarinimicrobiota bacterium]